MGTMGMIPADHLELLRSSAFESEHAQLYDSSYSQHEAAAIALEEEIENSLASISPDENSEENRRVIKAQIQIHRERQRALRPHLESGSGVEDGEGRECVFVPAPNHWGANGDLDDESGTLSSVSSVHANHPFHPSDFVSIISCAKLTERTYPVPPHMAEQLLTAVIHAKLR